MMSVILIINDGDLRPLGMEFLDLGHVATGIAERDKFEFRFTLRTMRGVEFDVHLPARRAAAAEVPVDQKARLDLIDMELFVNTDEFFAHECRLYQALSVFSKKSFLLLRKFQKTAVGWRGVPRISFRRNQAG